MLFISSQGYRITDTISILNQRVYMSNVHEWYQSVVKMVVQINVSIISQRAVCCDLGALEEGEVELEPMYC